MANFKTAIQKILKEEGGYSNSSSDTGKETYLGISRKWHPNWSGWPTIDRFKKEMKGRIPYAYRFPNHELMLLVHNFYLKNYWKAIKGDQLRDQKLAEYLLDTVVLHGHQGKRMIQKALVELGADLSIDGRLGQNSLAAMQAADPNSLRTTLSRMRMGYIDRIIANNKSQKAFENGWKKRVSVDAVPAH